MKRTMCLLTALLMAALLCLAGCGGSGEAAEVEEAAEAAGYYKCTRVYENGEEYEEYTRMTEYGIHMYLVLNEDGTGYLLNMGEQEELTWDDKQIGDGESSSPYTYQGGTLTVGESDGEMVYTKLAGDELDDFIKNGAPDWESRLEEMLTGALGDEEAAESSVSDEDDELYGDGLSDNASDEAFYAGDGGLYYSGVFSVAVPKGWIAFPADFLGDPDPANVHVFKDARDENDLFLKNRVDVGCDNKNLYSDLDEFLEYSAPLVPEENKQPAGPYTIGGRTWTGFDAFDGDGGYVLFLVAEGDGEKYFSAGIWYKSDMGGETISIDDEDVQMILSSLEEGQADGARGLGGSGSSAGNEDSSDSSSSSLAYEATPGDSKKQANNAAGGSHEDAGYYEIVSYEEDGENYHRTKLEEAGIIFDMMLYDDGTGYAHFMGDYYDLTWKDGTLYVETDEGTETLTYTTAYLGRNHIYIEDDISRMTFEYAGETDR